MSVDPIVPPAYSGGMATDGTASARLRSLRTSRELTHRSLADAVDLTEKTIQRIEGGQSIGTKAARRLADFFGVSVDFMMGRDVPTNEPSPEFLHWLENYAPANLQDYERESLARILPPPSGHPGPSYYSNILVGMRRGLDLSEWKAGVDATIEAKARAKGAVSAKPTPPAGKPKKPGH